MNTLYSFIEKHQALESRPKEGCCWRFRPGLSGKDQLKDRALRHVSTDAHQEDLLKAISSEILPDMTTTLTM